MHLSIPIGTHNWSEITIYGILMTTTDEENQSTQLYVDKKNGDMSSGSISQCDAAWIIEEL